MDLWFKVKQFCYSFVFNGLEFVFFFTRYWWWKLQWLLMTSYFNRSGHHIYEAEFDKAGDLEEKNFSFGETTALTTKLLLDHIPLNPGAMVYDLGSGRGGFLFSAYFLRGFHGVGVELFQTYIDISNNIRKKMKTASITFRQGNIKDTDLGGADLIYLPATTYQEDLVCAVVENIKKTPPGTLVIIVHHQLPEEDFVLFEEGCYPFSWGTDHVYFYRRK